MYGQNSCGLKIVGQILSGQNDIGRSVIGRNMFGRIVLHPIPDKIRNLTLAKMSFTRKQPFIFIDCFMLIERCSLYNG